jgi:vancomycin resistance protein YoaR
MERQFTSFLALLCVANLCSTVHGFSPSSQRRAFGLVNQHAQTHAPTYTRVWMADEDTANGDDSVEASEETVEASEETVEVSEVDESKAAAESEEDIELTALKEEIKQLESTLKSKRTNLSYTQESAEEYTKSGYARKVAEMENMRRLRSVSNFVCDEG